MQTGKQTETLYRKVIARHPCFKGQWLGGGVGKKLFGTLEYKEI